MYQKVLNDSSVLVSIIMKALEKIRLQGHMSTFILNYFLVQEAQFPGL